MQFVIATIVMKDTAHVLLAKANSGPDKGLWTIPDGTINDGETIRNACIRSIKEQTGLNIKPLETMFFRERVEPEDHRIGLFALATINLELESDESFKLGDRYSEIKWADVRVLADIQKTEGLSEFTADGFFKFHEYLEKKKNVASSPVSTTVN